MTAKHTKGPWLLEYVEGGKECVMAGATAIYLSRRSPGTGLVAISRDELRANASLIAAAPELLGALEELLGLWRRYAPALNGEQHGPVTRALRAIELAEP